VAIGRFVGADAGGGLIIHVLHVVEFGRSTRVAAKYHYDIFRGVDEFLPHGFFPVARSQLIVFVHERSVFYKLT